MPVYTGVTPTRPDGAMYTYTFSGWSPEIVVATADADYTAQFTATEKNQGIDDIVVDTDAPRKVLIDNVIYILRGDKVYTTTGQEVR